MPKLFEKYQNMMKNAENTKNMMKMLKIQKKMPFLRKFSRF
jgi:hypothetical protein